MTLALRSETLGWGKEAVLRDVTLQIADGERVALMGRSGVGKSTLLRALHDRADGRVAVVAQDHGLVDALSVFHNVWMGRLDDFGAARNLRTLIRPNTAERRSVEEVLDRVGLTGLGRRPVASLSGGQRQRVALARAMLRGGATVFADEPVSALDPAQGDALLLALSGDFGTSIMVLHDTGQALRSATRIVGLKAGGIVLDAATADVDAARLMELYT
ncbi:ATP-binding cassette domain-containing protein [Jannaschia donghaensis]|uniref:Macrolide export ATP-binding/permease protein MacB n=1 Tax=Jannaschia donghaensis TaxID=420998 RepID=A0A0M6YFI2_9RHOB|nr:ATP-binding cassette domain-containing protein [Jannaschia donghaensis]CTQ48027.1 Macrolide export ATP-binding/permease protein MacB [Jannaschia donghaensis]